MLRHNGKHGDACPACKEKGRIGAAMIEHLEDADLEVGDRVDLCVGVLAAVVASHAKPGHETDAMSETVRLLVSGVQAILREDGRSLRAGGVRLDPATGRVESISESEVDELNKLYRLSPINKLPC